MAQLESRKGELESARVQAAYIAAEKSNGFHKPAEFLEKNPVLFPFLLDEDRSVTKAYGLYHWIGLDAVNIAYPEPLVIDGGETARYLSRGSNQFDQASVD